MVTKMQKIYKILLLTVLGFFLIGICPVIDNVTLAKPAVKANISLSKPTARSKNNTTASEKIENKGNKNNINEHASPYSSHPFLNGLIAGTAITEILSYLFEDHTLNNLFTLCMALISIYFLFRFINSSKNISLFKFDIKKFKNYRDKENIVQKKNFRL